MLITKLKPQGFCLGVVQALNIIKENANNPDVKKPIYILGQIIHNKIVINELDNLGVFTVHDKNKSRLELLDLIDNGTVIFSAHGVSNKVYEKARLKKLDILDASCKYVLKVHQVVKEKLLDNYDIIYIGVKNHPECEGILGISSKIKLVTSLDDVANILTSNDKIYVTNQTTLGVYDLEKIHNKIKCLYPQAFIENGICNATSKRQEAVLKQNEADLCIIIGDKDSSNTKKLFEIGNNYTKIKTIMIENVNELADYDFTNIEKVNISSGASTPSYVVDQVIDYLNKLK